MTLFVTGRRTTIVAELEKLLPMESVQSLGNVLEPATYVDPHYVLAGGVLHSKRSYELHGMALSDSILCNMGRVIQTCDWLLDNVHNARICVIGSESARNGSFDRIYAACKAGVHAYVQQRPTNPLQQLVCVSPPIIADSGMTRRRHDYPEVLEKRPHVYAIDVARVIKRVLYDRPPNEITGCVVSVHPTITPEQPHNGQSKGTA